MPEGDSIARLAAEVRARAQGRSVTSSIFRHPRLATLDVAGRTLVDVTSHGKHLFLHWDDGWSLRVHLLMDGRIRFGSGGPPPVEEWRRRFEIVFGDEQAGAGAVTRMTGIDIPVLHRVRTTDVGRLVDHLGPDLCGCFGPVEFGLALARLEADPTPPLAGALLDQRNVAGFGNIYAVEVPFICGVSPFRPVGELVGLGDLLAIGAALIRTNARLGPQKTTGRRLRTGDHWVLGDRTRACPRCGDRVERRSGDETPWRRRTAWCPTCQPGDPDGPVRAVDTVTVDTMRARKLLALHPARRDLTFDDGGSISFTGPEAPVEPTS